MSTQKEIYLAGGCFWGTEAFMSRVPGAIATTVGYANGRGENPSYEQVCGGDTGFAETVKLVYDPEILSLERLCQAYFQTINPTSLNKQGGDVGSQYRSGIFYVDEGDRPTITAALAELGKAYEKPIVVENLPLENFYPAEEYHQKYLDKNPHGYCHVDLGKLAGLGGQK